MKRRKGKITCTQGQIKPVSVGPPRDVRLSLVIYIPTVHRIKSNQIEAGPGAAVRQNFGGCSADVLLQHVAEPVPCL